MRAHRRTLQLLLTAAALPALLAVPIALAAQEGAPAGEFSGRYVLRHSDDFARGKAVFQPSLELASGEVVALQFTPGKKPAVNPGATVKLRGQRKGGSIAVADGSTQVTGSGTTTVAATTTKRVAVVLFTFSNATTQPYTPAHAAGIAFNNANSVAAHTAATSWGQVEMTGDVFGWYQIAAANTSCAYSTWATQANQAAAAAGVDLNQYQHVVYGFPSVSSCGWSGLAYMPGKYSWLNGSGGMSLRVMSHELGHNFGTHHASTMSCTEGGARVPLATSQSSCTSSEYGDPFTVMGASSKYEHTSYSRGNFGWLPTANAQTVTASGDYTLRPLEGGTGLMAIRVQRTSSSFLTLELRQPSGVFDDFAATSAVASGVTVRMTTAFTSRSQSQLVDTTPSTTSFGDAPLAVGRTLTDPLTNASITTLSVSPTGATVRISFVPDTSAPTTPGNLNATALDTSRVSLTWNASTDNMGVAGYRVFRNSSLVTTVTGTSFTDTGLAAATTYAYQVVAVDAAGNVSAPASASATTMAADTTPPSPPANLTASMGKGKKVLLSWSASTDNLGVAGYRVIRDSKQVGQTQTTSYTDTLSGKTPKATYVVVAYDAAGNVSAPSSALSVP